MPVHPRCAALAVDTHKAKWQTPYPACRLAAKWLERRTSVRVFAIDSGVNIFLKLFTLTCLSLQPSALDYRGAEPDRWW